MSTFNLEIQSSSAAEWLHIDRHAWVKFRTELDKLKLHDEATFCHCLRVGLYALGLANTEDLGCRKLCLFGGTGHDQGKCLVSTEVINAPVWSKELSDEMHKHARAGFDRWKKDFLFTAFVAGLHHYYQPNGYGIDPDVDIPSHFKEDARRTIIQATKLVMVSDFFDAITTRKNDKGLVSDPNNLEEVGVAMVDRFPEQKTRVLWLLGHKIND